MPGNVAPSYVVAAVQMRSAPGRCEENRDHSLAWIKRAADAGARLVVLPELCISGYDLSDPEQAQQSAEPIPGASTTAWQEAARRHGIWIAGGLVERSGDRLYNTAVLVGPERVVGTYRKAHLFYRETLLFAPGDVGFPVWETPLGRLGLLICYDLRFPEAVRLLALEGTDVILVPTAWVVLAPRPRSMIGDSACRRTVRWRMPA